MEHVKLTKEGFTHWSSGPGNPTFDPECGACWEAEIDRLKTEPQRCNSGHKRWPITLWDCPDCVVTRLVEKDTTIATLTKAIQDYVFWQQKEGRHCDLPSGAPCQCGLCHALATTGEG